MLSISSMRTLPLCVPAGLSPTRGKMTRAVRGAVGTISEGIANGSLLSQRSSTCSHPFSAVRQMFVGLKPMLNVSGSSSAHLEDCGFSSWCVRLLYPLPDLGNFRFKFKGVGCHGIHIKQAKNFCCSCVVSDQKSGQWSLPWKGAF